MILNDVMTKDPKYITPETSLQDAARQLRDLDVGFLPVGDGRKLKGTLTDRDITVRAVAEGIDLKSAHAGDYMTDEVLYAYDDESVDFAIKTMREKQVRRLIVVNRDKDLVGIVSLGDLATRTGEEGKKAEALKGVSAD
jgi:CBS domain-containing protein